MTKKITSTTSASSYDEVFRRIQEMERLQFKEENDRDFDLYMKNNKYNKEQYHYNSFERYETETRNTTVNC